MDRLKFDKIPIWENKQRIEDLTFWRGKLASVPVSSVLRAVYRPEPCRPCVLDFAPEQELPGVPVVPVAPVVRRGRDRYHLYPVIAKPPVSGYPAQSGAFPDIEGDGEARILDDPIAAWDFSPLAIVVGFGIDKEVIHRHDR